MGHMWENNGAFFRPELAKRPSAYANEDCLVALQDDPPGMLSVDQIQDCIAWRSDYPHGEGTFAHSREKIEACMTGLSAKARRRICAENAASFFQLDLEAIVKKCGPQSEPVKHYGDTDGGAR